MEYAREKKANKKDQQVRRGKLWVKFYKRAGSECGRIAGDDRSSRDNQPRILQPDEGDKKTDSDRNPVFHARAERVYELRTKTR